MAREVDTLSRLEYTILTWPQTNSTPYPPLISIAFLSRPMLTTWLKGRH